jgi:hypothetical protein
MRIAWDLFCMPHVLLDKKRPAPGEASLIRSGDWGTCGVMRQMPPEKIAN